MTVIPASLALHIHYNKQKPRVFILKKKSQHHFLLMQPSVVHIKDTLRLIVFHHGRGDIGGSDNILLVLDSSSDDFSVVDIRDQTILYVQDIHQLSAKKKKDDISSFLDSSQTNLHRSIYHQNQRPARVFFSIRT